MSEAVNLNFELWSKQEQAYYSDANYILYGGAAGGGKSHLARVWSIASCLEIPNLHVYVFRRRYGDLQKGMVDGANGYRALLAPLISAGVCDMVELEARFNNGSKIYFCHAHREMDVWNYLGAEIHFLILEEATQFTEYQVRFLLARCRIPDTVEIPKKQKKLWPKVLATSNPGGPSHSYFKTLFVDPHFAKKRKNNPHPLWKMDDLEGGWTATYIPARLEDNPSLDKKQYTAGLMSLRRKDLVDAMLEGKWDVPLGAMFPECDERKHVISSFDVPRHWFKFRTFDWGSGSPGAVIWWAVSDGNPPPGYETALPRGSLIAYREWYVASMFDTKQGLGLSDYQYAEGIKNRTPADELIQGTVTDSKPFQANGGQTIAEQMKRYGVPLQMGDVSPGSRVQGWQLLRSRLIGFDHIPRIFFFRECKDTWRTLVGLQTDKHNPEDADTHGEDHAPDAVSLACKAHSVVIDAPVSKLEGAKAPHTFQTMLKAHLKAKRLENAAVR